MTTQALIAHRSSPGDATRLSVFGGGRGASAGAIRVPVLFIIGDHDFTTIEHAGLMLDRTPGSQLLVLAGTTHMQATHRVDVLDPALAAFLN